jgi:hypothetical protein
MKQKIEHSTFLPRTVLEQRVEETWKIHGIDNQGLHSERPATIGDLVRLVDTLKCFDLPFNQTSETLREEMRYTQGINLNLYNDLVARDEEIKRLKVMPAPEAWTTLYGALTASHAELVAANEKLKEWEPVVAMAQKLACTGTLEHSFIDRCTQLDEVARKISEKNRPKG